MCLGEGGVEGDSKGGDYGEGDDKEGDGGGEVGTKVSAVMKTGAKVTMREAVKMIGVIGNVVVKLVVKWCRFWWGH